MRGTGASALGLINLSEIKRIVHAQIPNHGVTLMHTRELAELAAQLATEGSGLLHTAGDFDQNGIEQYWVASRCRLDRWSKAFARHSAKPQNTDGPKTAGRWALLRPTLEEILISEVLTRVWTAVAIGRDKVRGTAELEPVARSILAGHLEARHRTLDLMVHGQGYPVEEAVTLNRLRRKCERWNDLLLSGLSNETNVTEFSFDESRVHDFALELQENSRQGLTQPAWQVSLASLRVSFQRGLKPVAANPDLNEQIASGIISCFPAESFDSLGVFRPSWLIRMHNITSDTQGLLDEILASEDPDHHPETSVRGLENQLRRF